MKSFKEAYDPEVRAYMDQCGNYCRAQYDEAEVRCMLEGYLDTGKARDIARRAGLLREISYLDGPERVVGAATVGQEGAGTVYVPTESCAEEPPHMLGSGRLGAALCRVT